MMFDQHEESIKDLGREDNGAAVAQKAASGMVQAKRAKLVEVPRHIEDTAAYNNLLLLTCWWGKTQVTNIPECRAFRRSLARFRRDSPRTKQKSHSQGELTMKLKTVIAAVSCLCRRNMKNVLRNLGPRPSQGLAVSLVCLASIIA